MNDLAFPMQWDDGSSCNGMSLRDYFAAKAMEGMLSNSETAKDTRKQNHTPDILGEEVSQAAYIIADAMIVHKEESKNHRKQSGEY
jgi:hypothetical protein